MRMNITVYLGANEGNDPALRRAVEELGRWIGTKGHRLVYGGSKTGLMGALARSVLESGGQAIGVEPQFFMDAGFQYDGLTEVMSQVSLGQLDAPCILYDLNGYYDELRALLRRMIDMGLSSPERQQGIYFAGSLMQIADILNSA